LFSHILYAVIPKTSLIIIKLCKHDVAKLTTESLDSQKNTFGMLKIFY
jgi:hypothetical protein